MRKARVVAVKWHAWDDAIEAYRLRVVGYRVGCDCGYIGRVRRYYSIANADLAEHECEAGTAAREPAKEAS